VVLAPPIREKAATNPFERSKAMTTIKKVLPTLARLFMGLVFTVFGLNFFFHFIPMPPPAPRAAAFMGGLASGGYLLQLVHGVEVVMGVLLLANRRVPLALTILAPIIVNVLAFHIALAPEGLPIPLVLLGLEVYLAWTYRAVFAPMLNGVTQPAATPVLEGGRIERQRKVA
jgi:putative oxidoreductase